MKNKGLIATIVIMCGVIVILLVTLLFIKMPQLGLMDILDFRKETINIDETDNVVVNDEPVVIVETPKLDVKINTYEGYNGNVEIEYPEITGMEDAELQDKINNKLKTNALSIVPLYPISTALQDLSIFCEVNYLDEKYITVLYRGEVVGKGVNKSSSTGSSGSSGSTGSSSASDDLYLNGFVDPLGQAQTQNINQVTNFNVFGDLPLPGYGTGTVERPASNTTQTQTQQGVLNGIKTSENEHTADKGPTVYEEPAPSGKAYDGLHSSAQDAVTGPGVVGTPTYGAPVTGFAGSNTSARTIDQKIFYSNTIDLTTGMDVALKDIADPATLAKYARSSKAEFVNIPENMTKEVRAYVRKTIEPTLTEQLEKETDFRNEDLKVWPKHFSFVGSDGNIYFTVKLSSKLGNYVIIKYQK